MPRKVYDISGDAHFLTFSCYRRLPLLAKDRTRKWFIDALNLGRSRQQFELWAYVIMPEHVHLVIWPQSDVRLSDILITVKQSVAKRALHWLTANAPEFLPNLSDLQPSGKSSYRFWQRGGGYDRNLRSVADIHEKIRYIHENPVRRGLVASAEAWRWSSAVAWATGSCDPIGIDRESVPPLIEHLSV